MGMTSGFRLAAESESSRVPLPGGGSLSAVRMGEAVMLLVHERPELAPQVELNLDTSVMPGSTPALAVVAELDDGVIILEDSYPSRPGGLSFCQAGSERFVRVLKLTRPPAQTLRVKTESCLDSLDLDDPGIVWNAEAKALEIHWLDGRNAVYRIDAAGQIKSPA